MIRMRLRVLLVVVLVGLWALWGSVALAFDHCVAMGALCEAPCGSATVVEDPSCGTASGPPATFEPLSGPSLSMLAVRGLDPVPRPLRLSA